MGLTRGLKFVTVVTAILIMVQAMLAGRGWFVDYDLISLHGWIGQATFTAAIIQTLLAVLLWRGQAVPASLAVASALLLLLVVAQLGLGYGGRSSQEAASWHIPNGVLIFGLSIAITMRVFAPTPSPPTVASSDTVNARLSS